MKKEAEEGGEKNAENVKADDKPLAGAAFVDQVRNAGKEASEHIELQPLRKMQTAGGIYSNDKKTPLANLLDTCHKKRDEVHMVRHVIGAHVLPFLGLAENTFQPSST